MNVKWDNTNPKATIIPNSINTKFLAYGFRFKKLITIWLTQKTQNIISITAAIACQNPGGKT